MQPGFVVAAASPDGTAPQPVTTFAYDYRGRRTSVTDANGRTTTYAYDDADRLTSVTDAASGVTTYTYDTENNLTSITDAKSLLLKCKGCKANAPLSLVEQFGDVAISLASE